MTLDGLDGPVMLVHKETRLGAGDHQSDRGSGSFELFQFGLGQEHFSAISGGENSDRVQTSLAKVLTIHPNTRYDQTNPSLRAQAIQNTANPFKTNLLEQCGSIGDPDRTAGRGPHMQLISRELSRDNRDLGHAIHLVLGRSTSSQCHLASAYSATVDKARLFGHMNVTSGC
jgi:hypothetical protein